MTDTLPASTLAVARTFLFVPGSRPERFEKAAAAGADVIVIDLEDAVSPADKDSARDNVATWLADGNTAVVRVNADDTPWHTDDVAMLRQYHAAAMPAKSADADSVAALADTTGAPVIPLIETARGIRAAYEISDIPGAVRVAFGAIDFAAELGIDPNDREALLLARSTLVLAAAAAGIAAPIDGVTTALREPDVLADDVRYAVRIGMTGKLCIHPAQVTGVHDCLAPSAEDVEWAQRVLAADDGSGNAIAVDGHMIDAPVLIRARRILATAARSAAP